MGKVKGKGREGRRGREGRGKGKRTKEATGMEKVRGKRM